MRHPVDIADAVARDADRFGLILAAAQHAREMGNNVVKWQAPPSGARCAVALNEVALDAHLRREAWQRLIERQRRTGEVDAPSETELLDEASLIQLLSDASDRDDLAA
ncbi:hypothetical protein SAMN05216196_11374 [Lutimaribacter pacificus]|uniref:DNA-directed RNA polymerase subunit omega n=1 Tax=Lutimaribacter pacificus TaxID=391948 RepID=A0A1H0NLD8_9RHOB|nr:hypothetical protein [Lutimaribacter pacificus]SDO93493.1 hypothetical protein SAMN05216196_11374 [Lutimaribacter pacificus]SHK88209.1 hypothetical protein SAMN05444142_1128 [Lutimaribacter pacificus]